MFLIYEGDMRDGSLEGPVFLFALCLCFSERGVPVFSDLCEQTLF